MYLSPPPANGLEMRKKIKRGKKRKKENLENITFLAVPNHNRSPKGNMWSAIPVALLCFA